MAPYLPSPNCVLGGVAAGSGERSTALVAAAAISLIAHFLVRASKSLVTQRTGWAAGLEMTVAGVIVGAVTYTAGLLFQVGGL